MISCLIRDYLLRRASKIIFLVLYCSDSARHSVLYRPWENEQLNSETPILPFQCMRLASESWVNPYPRRHACWHWRMYCRCRPLIAIKLITFHPASFNSSLASLSLIFSIHSTLGFTVAYGRNRNIIRSGFDGLCALSHLGCQISL